MSYNPKMNAKDLSPELKEKARACQTSNEMIELAHEEGIELTIGQGVNSWP